MSTGCIQKSFQESIEDLELSDLLNFLRGSVSFARLATSHPLATSQTIQAMASRGTRHYGKPCTIRSLIYVAEALRLAVKSEVTPWDLWVAQGITFERTLGLWGRGGADADMPSTDLVTFYNQIRGLASFETLADSASDCGHPVGSQTLQRLGDRNRPFTDPVKIQTLIAAAVAVNNATSFRTTPWALWIAEGISFERTSGLWGRSMRDARSAAATAETDAMLIVRLERRVAQLEQEIATYRLGRRVGYRRP